MKKIFLIKNIDEDSYKIKSLVNDNELDFKKNIALSRKIQSINANARLNMIRWMKDNEYTKKDFIDVVEKDGKTYYDETTYREIEQGFISDESKKVSDEIFEILFNKTLEEVLLYLGFTNDDQSEALRLGLEINNILTTKFPR